jgi:hypothetical protein
LKVDAKYQRTQVDPKAKRKVDEDEAFRRESEKAAVEPEAKRLVEEVEA